MLHPVTHLLATSGPTQKNKNVLFECVTVLVATLFMIYDSNFKFTGGQLGWHWRPELKQVEGFTLSLLLCPNHIQKIVTHEIC